jgi:phosphatidylglycerophosphate synthase
MPDNTYLPTERRPLAARSWPLFRLSASWLSRRGASPNGISIIGMAASLIAGGLLVATSFDAQDGRFLWFGTVLLIIVRALANILDGMVAIESKRASRLGEIFNDVPDRISDAAMLIGLGFAKGGVPLLGFTAALVAVFTAYVRVMGKVAGAPQDYCGPMAKPQRMWVVVAVCCFGAIAPESIAARLEAIHVAVPALALWLIIAGCVLTSARRLQHAAAQLRSQP